MTLEDDSHTESINGSESHAESMAEESAQMEAPSQSEGSPNQSIHESGDSEMRDSQMKPRGRPVGKPDSTKRYRRTAQEISDDKIKIVQMKLDAMKVSEALRMSNRKPRSKRVSPILREADGDVEPKKVTLSSLSSIREKKRMATPISISGSISREAGGEDSPISISGRSPSTHIDEGRRPAHRRQSLYDSWFPPSPRTMR